jgi:hypothetical protein
MTGKTNFDIKRVRARGGVVVSYSRERTTATSRIAVALNAAVRLFALNTELLREEDGAGYYVGPAWLGCMERIEAVSGAYAY